MLVTLSKDVVVWDVARRAKRYRVHPASHPSHCDFDPSGTRLAMKTTSGKIVILHAADGSTARVFDDGSEGEGANLMFSACSQFIVDGSWKGSLTVRDVATGKTEFLRQREGEMVRAVRADAARQSWAIQHGHKCPTGSPRPDYVSLWKWPFRDPTVFEHAAHFVIAFDLSADGRLIATCALVHGKGYRLTVHSASDFEVLAELWLDEAAYVKEVCWSPDGAELAVVRRDGFSFYRYPDLALTATFELKYAADVAYARGGDLVALSGWAGGVLLRRDAIPPVSSGKARQKDE
jgi:WD40 repeat protein